jgi:hypothetical protein
MPTIDFNTIQELINYTNQYIVENHNNEINGEQHNNVEIGLAKFITESPRNWNKAKVIGSSGFYSANDAECFLIFKPNAIGSIELVNNKWNEWTIVNQTPQPKQLVQSINSYLKTDGTSSNVIPANTIVSLALGTDNKWYEVSNRGTGGGSNDVYVRLEFTVDGSPLIMEDGDTVLEIAQPGVVQDSFYIEYIGGGELPRTLTDQQAYGVDYSDPEKVTATFLYPVGSQQTYVIHYTYRP